MIMGAVDSIESFGLVDGPGIRTVVFLSGCKLRCKFCHNPEMWAKGKENYTPDLLVKKILRNKPYFKRNNGGVTFSGGEPLLQVEFLLDVFPLLKKEGIHIALDTSGVGKGYYQEILSYVDLVLLDIKHITDSGYLDLTGSKMTEFKKFVTCLNESGKKVWIRQVIVPGVHDNMDYINGLASFLKQIKNIEKVEFLPYHKLGDEKYTKLGILNPYQDKEAMDTVLCENLYQEFEAIYYERNQRD